MMAQFGLIGEKLPHSFSPVLHRKLNNIDYDLWEVPRESIDAFLDEASFSAANVTIPYKEVALAHCIPSEAAGKIGCVNTLVKRNGTLYGYNTDYLGFCYMLDKAGIDLRSKNVLILGSGGTSKTACYAAAMKKAKKITVLSRSAKSYEMDVSCELSFTDYSDSRIFEETQVLINTTPVGMYPRITDEPIDLHLFTRLEGVADVVYNPLKTSLVQTAEKAGIRATNGLMMLVAQAWYAGKLFNGLETVAGDKDFELMNRVYEEIHSEKQNIVLIGMPGCGKTTVGSLLAKKLERKFFDCDEEFTAFVGMTPADYIVKYGEDAFRDRESAVITQMCGETEAVISTGGGSILRNVNVLNLKKNGKLVYLHQVIDNLSTQNRPLSSESEKLKGLYYKRLPIYKKCADIKVLVAEDSDSTVTKIQKAMAGEKRTMKILIMNGPNINMLGIREPEIYGNSTYADLMELCRKKADELGVEVAFVQSNHEGVLVDEIQKAYGVYDGIIINPAAYTHTSVALLDAVKAVSVPVVEVHISDPDQRDEFRKVSYIRAAAVKTIKGQGLAGYAQALEFLCERLPLLK